ncbi:MAG: phospholipase D-like domain-containing protein [Byssovorax sp.]
MTRAGPSGRSGKIAEDFRAQLAGGIPTAADERTLRQLASQIRRGIVRVRLYLREPLHAKLYLVHRLDPVSPAIAYLGSSNLTFSGLRGQGELNVDVLDVDACDKLARWFQRRWEDKFSLDVPGRPRSGHRRIVGPRADCPAVLGVPQDRVPRVTRCPGWAHPRQEPLPYGLQERFEIVGLTPRADGSTVLPTLAERRAMQLAAQIFTVMPEDHQRTGSMS